MIDFNEVVRRFGKPGTIINMVSELAIVVRMDKECCIQHSPYLYMDVIFARNIGRSIDHLDFNQTDAERYQMDKWQVATKKDLALELNAIIGHKIGEKEL